MKNFLKSMLLEDEDPATKPVAKPATAVPMIKPPPQTAAYRPPVATAAEHPEVRATLEKALEAAAHPALSALQKSMLKLEKAVPDFDARLSASLALLDGGSSNPKQVVVDINECLAALQIQEKKALDGAATARQTQVGGIDSKLTKNEQRLKELEAERDRLITESSNLTLEKERAAGEIEAMLGAITGTAEQIRNELTALKASVEQKGV